MKIKYKQVSLIILSWNGKALLERNLPSVINAAGKYDGCEIIVVDNGSTDGSREYIRNKYHGLRLVPDTPA